MLEPEKILEPENIQDPEPEISVADVERMMREQFREKLFILGLLD